MPTPFPILQADRLHVSLGGNPILRNLAFTIRAGEWIGLLGPNGSGKTTLMRTIGGTLPYAGALIFEGRALRAWKPKALARRMAFMQQAPPPAFDFTVEELVLLGRTPHKNWLEAYSSEDRRKVRDALAEVDLRDLAHRAVHTLSGGERQRVYLAQALVQQAEVLLLDEPTAHLDIHHQFELLGRVRRLVREGRVALAVFHDLELAARYADRLLVLQGGALVADGAPDRVLTPLLIEQVFRMRAEVSPTGEDGLRIRYLYPVNDSAPRAGS